MVLQLVNIYEWINQVGSSLSNSYFVISCVATVFKFDAGLVGLFLSLGYGTRDKKQKDVPSFVKTTSNIFIWMAGAFSLITLIVTFHELHAKAIGVVWVILLVMIG